MAWSQRPGEITYYDELGVDAAASADEIRDAFRALARLLHPDQQTDPQLKEMAERQMRKLNRIYGVLSDSTRRAAYDHSLRAARSAPIIVFSGSDVNLKKLLVRGGTVAGIVFVTCLLIWFAFDTSGSEVRGQEARGMSSSKSGDSNNGDNSDQITRLRAQLRTMETERNSALLQLDRLRPKQSGILPTTRTPGPSAPLAEPLNTATALTELPSDATVTPRPSVAVTPVANPPAPSATGATQFAGVWVYSKPSGSAAITSSASPESKAQYPPDFIQVTVTEQNGVLHGQYRSRYEVLDHAISPDVDFDFAGRPGGSALNCAWFGPGGARGHITLKLLPTRAVEIVWNATELGSQQWLVNGTTTLTRK